MSWAASRSDCGFEGHGAAPHAREGRRLHWPKANGLDRRRLRAAYGDHVDRWVASRWTLLAGVVERRVFSNAFIGNGALTKSGWADSLRL